MRSSDVEQTAIDRVLDLRGQVCPHTLIESMTALEEIQEDAVLKIVLDYLPAVRDVPRTLRKEGYEVIAVYPSDVADWVILVRNTALGREDGGVQ
jgi:tRNA 2-thiouridine synthesizing protein A